VVLVGAVGIEPTSLNHELLARQFATIRPVRFYIMDANLESGVSQDTGPQSNELEQPVSYLGRSAFDFCARTYAEAAPHGFSKH